MFSFPLCSTMHCCSVPPVDIIGVLEGLLMVSSLRIGNHSNTFSKFETVVNNNVVMYIHTNTCKGVFVIIVACIQHVGHSVAHSFILEK